MATTKIAKKAPAKKTVSKAAPSKPAADATPRDHRIAVDSAQVAKVIKLRGKDGSKMSLKDAAEEMGLPVGKTAYLFLCGTVEKVDTTEAKLGKVAAKLRREGKSWGVISAATGFNEGFCRTAFEAETGESASDSDIGKGGRKPGAMTTSNRAPKGRGEGKAAKPAPNGKGKGKLPFTAKSSNGEIGAAIEGRTITYGGAKLEVVEVVKFGKVSGERGVKVRLSDDSEKALVISKITAVA